MGKLIIIMTFIFNYSLLLAQDESYRGGESDGYGLASLTTTSESPIAYQPFFGGNADGYGSDSSITFDSRGYINIYSPFSGNNADGYTSDSLISFDGRKYINMYYPFAGGEADGWASYPIFGVSVLPLNLLTFKGEQQQRKHILQWITDNERNTAYFDVERSINGTSYSSLGKVDVLRGSSSRKQYKYTDERPTEGNNFYRLKMFDADGSFKYSSVVLLKLLSSDISIAMYPNPTAQLLNIVLNNVPAGENITASVIDLSGRVLKSKQIVSSNVNNLNFNINELSAGMYLLQIVVNNEKSVWRFVKE